MLNTKKLLIGIALSLLSFATYSHELDDALGSDIKVLQSGNYVTIEYCPDNTCEVFSLKSSSNENLLKDFAFTYLFSRSNYIYLENFQAEQNGVNVQNVLARYKSICPQSSAKLSASCIVNVLARRHPIKAYFVRHDEGAKSSIPISLAK